jgi:hypothetical protein
MNSIIKNIVLFTIITLNTNCGNEKGIEFESKKWISDKIGHNNTREKMIGDLIKSELLIGIKFDSVVNLLGNEFYKYESETNRKVTFTIKESYGFDIDPLFTKDLIVEIDKKTERILSVEYSESKDRRSFIEKIFTD